MAERSEAISAKRSFASKIEIKDNLTRSYKNKNYKYFEANLNFTFFASLRLFIFSES